QVSVTDAAKRLGVNRVTLARILGANAGISPDMDLRLAKALGTTPGMWYSMQGAYDMWQARKRFRGGKVRPIVQRQGVAA
ncbi:MAG: HigA family addiction module antidote protein, partial [Nevskiaceae bacterium]|nr:HigA family addiction module antidote protein [Nevskiaceae bacterium]